MCRFRLTASLLLLYGCSLQSAAIGDDIVEEVIEESREVPDQISADNETRLRRAGCPNIIARWARFTYGPKYCGYFVGGGAALYGQPPTKLRGEPRYPFEGTWGMDYQPWYSRVRLQWFHGKRIQDGDGQYEPDELNNPLIPLIFR